MTFQAIQTIGVLVLVAVALAMSYLAEQYEIMWKQEKARADRLQKLLDEE